MCGSGRNMSRKYIRRWDMAGGSASRSTANARGIVCIVQHSTGASEPLTCADVHLFPGINDDLGVDENRFKKWQDEYGFHSGGVSPTGAMLAPGYPIYSRLAWTHIDPVYLQGDDLSALLEETKRISENSNDSPVRGTLDKLTTLATDAQQGSQVLRFFG
jgi:hypothetical protein